MQKEIKSFCAGKSIACALKFYKRLCRLYKRQWRLHKLQCRLYKRHRRSKNLWEKKGFPAKHPCFWGGSLYLLRIFAIRCDPKHCFPPLVRPEENTSTLQGRWPRRGGTVWASAWRIEGALRPAQNLLNPH